MFRRNFNTEQGSTYIMILISLAVLSILGTAVISYGVVNFKMKNVEKNIKTAFYLAESGIEEGYTVMCSEIKEAIAEANTKVQNDIPDFIDRQREREAADPYDDDSEYIRGTDGTGSVNKDKVEEKMQEIFEDEFTDYIDTNVDNVLRNHTYTAVDDTIDTNSATVTVKSVDKFNNGSIYEIKLSSSFDYKDINRKIEHIFKIGIPIFSGNYTSSNVSVPHNILNSALASKERIHSLGGRTIQIHGDAYCSSLEKIINNKIHVHGGLNNGNLVDDFFDGVDFTKIREIHIENDNERIYVGNRDIELDYSLNPRTQLNGFIITTGNVTIKGKYDYRGLIIAKGNIYLNANSDNQLQIRSNSAYINDVINNYVVLRDMFLGSGNGSEQVVENVDNNISLDTLIDKEGWKVDK